MLSVFVKSEFINLSIMYYGTGNGNQKINPVEGYSPKKIIYLYECSGSIDRKQEITTST